MIRKNIDINKLNEIYSGTSISIRIHKHINRQLVLKEKSFIINKIYIKEQDIFNRNRREDILVIEFKGKYKNQLEITNKNIIFYEEFENPIFAFVDDTLKFIINIFRNP
jgi:hypothetical protein